VDLRVVFDPHTHGILSIEDLRIGRGDPPAAAKPHLSAARYGSSITGNARIFNPNPIAAGAPAETRDGDPLDAYRRPVLLERLDGSGRLRGLWIAAENRRPPVAEEPSLVFDYAAWDPRFEEAMAYYHADRCVARAESLGFAGLLTQPLRVLLHATDADNSWYSRVERQVVFGDGGVDDAEDADIVYHEMGHVLHDALVPGFNGGHSEAISEGFSDFWAASLTGDPCVGEWDATGYGSPCLRRIGGDASFPVSLTGRPHSDGLIWSGLLWDLRAALGRETAERLALAAFLEQSIAPTFPEAGRGLLRAAEELGLHGELPRISEALSKRGLIPREFDFVVGPEEVRCVDLLDPATFLHRPVEALICSGDGTLSFSPDPRPLLAGLPGNLPMVRPGLRSPLPDLAHENGGVSEGRHIRIRGTFTANRADLQQLWMEGDQLLARVTIGWSFADGDFEWSYAEVSPGVSVSAELSAGAVPAELFTSVELDGLPPGGLAGLRAFRGQFNSQDAQVLGASFRVETEGVEFEGMKAERAQSQSEEAPGAEIEWAETGRAETGRAQTERLETGRMETGRAETAGAEMGRTETGRAETGSAEAGRAEAVRAGTGRTETGRAVAGRATTERAETGRTETGRAVAGRATTERAETGRTETGRAVAGKATTERAETGRTEIHGTGTFRLLEIARGLGKLTGGLDLDTRPNPFRGTAHLRLCQAEAGPVRIRVYNLSGRQVRALHSGLAPGGVTEFSWDGADDAGAPAPAGVYWIRADGGAGHAVSRIIRLR